MKLGFTSNVIDYQSMINTAAQRAERLEEKQIDFNGLSSVAGLRVGEGMERPLVVSRPPYDADPSTVRVTDRNGRTMDVNAAYLYIKPQTNVVK